MAAQPARPRPSVAAVVRRIISRRFIRYGEGLAGGREQSKKSYTKICASSRVSCRSWLKSSSPPFLPPTHHSNTPFPIRVPSSAWRGKDVFHNVPDISGERRPPARRPSIFPAFRISWLPYLKNEVGKGGKSREMLRRGGENCRYPGKKSGLFPQRARTEGLPSSRLAAPPRLL